MSDLDLVGLLIPEDWPNAAGLSADAYHLMAVGIGAVAGVCTLVGVSLLVYRRRTTGAVMAATTKNDKTMYVFLIAAICLGLLTTIIGSGVLGDGYNYRETVSPWVRSIILFRPQPDLMAEAPLPDDPAGALVPVSYKIVHEIRGDEHDGKLRDLVERLHGHVSFDGRRVLYSWIGGTRRDWRGQGHFRALTEESETLSLIPI